MLEKLPVNLWLSPADVIRLMEIHGHRIDKDFMVGAVISR